MGPFPHPLHLCRSVPERRQAWPLEYSEAEKTLRKAISESDGAFYNPTLSGSMPTSKRAITFLPIRERTYGFTLRTSHEKTVFLLTRRGDPLLPRQGQGLYSKAPMKRRLFRSRRARAGGGGGSTARLPVSPYVRTDSAGRDLIGRSMYGARCPSSSALVAALIVLCDRAPPNGANIGACGGWWIL